MNVPRRVIVFGGSGFIGSHVADALSDAGHAVTIFDRRVSPYLRADQQFVQGDMLDAAQVNAAVAGNDVLYNFAGIAHLDIGLGAPLETVQQNILGTVTMLEAARLAGIKRFVYASSIYVYSAGGSFYRCSKQAAELYVDEYQRLHGLDYTIIRYGTVYGPRADDHNSVRRYLKQALRDGKIVASGSGDEIREYVHVVDAARLSVAILDDEFRNEHVTLTGHHSMRFSDLLTMLQEVVGGSVEIEFRPPAADDARYGDSGHFIVTPYSFRPKHAKKLVANPYHEMGQGLLDCIEELYDQEAPPERMHPVVVGDGATLASPGPVAGRVTIAPDALHGVIVSVLEAAGVVGADAALVAGTLVEAELAGHASHGAIRVVEYLDGIRTQRIVPNAPPRALRAESATTLLVDAQHGFGQVAARWTIDRVIDKAAEHGIAIAGIHNCAHIGRLGPYMARAAERGLVALAFVNGGGTKPRVAPFGGAQPLFGTNPVAAAIPVADQAPIVVDFSTAVVASGKIRVLRDRGEVLPDGWILDRRGRPSTAAADYYDGGMLLPAGGHKGYGLMVLAEVLGGLLTSAGSVATAADASSVGNGTCFVAIDPSAFLEREVFADSVRAMCDAIKKAPPAEGFVEVLLPGEPEQRARDRAVVHGIELADTTWRGLWGAAEQLGVARTPRERK